MALRLEKLVRFAEGNPMYTIKRLGDVIELRAAAPSIQDAASSTDVPEVQERSIVIILRESNGNVEPVEAYVEAGDEKRPLSLEEVRWWLDIIDSMS